MRGDDMKKEIKIKLTKIYANQEQYVYYGPVSTETLFNGVVVGDPKGLMAGDYTLSWEEKYTKHSCKKLRLRQETVERQHGSTTWDWYTSVRSVIAYGIDHCPRCGMKLGD